MLLEAPTSSAADFIEAVLLIFEKSGFPSFRDASKTWNLPAPSFLGVVDLVHLVVDDELLVKVFLEESWLGFFCLHVG